MSERRSAENLASIAAYRSEASDNLLPPRNIDVRSSEWAVGKVEAIFCANMIHISPWSCTIGLVEGVGRNLTSPGVFVLYGPFRMGGKHTSDSNAEFDRDLRARDPSWGVRDMESVADLAANVGLAFTECIPMPANNHASCLPVSAQLGWRSPTSSATARAAFRLTAAHASGEPYSLEIEGSLRVRFLPAGRNWPSALGLPS